MNASIGANIKIVNTVEKGGSNHMKITMVRFKINLKIKIVLVGLVFGLLGKAINTRSPASAGLF